MTRTPLSAVRFIAVDLEGNGGSPPEIVEIAWVPFTLQRFAASFQSLVRPDTPITPIVERKHGISNDDVSHAPRFEELAKTVSVALMGRVLVAHRAAVEVTLLSRALGTWPPMPVIDTFQLARSVLPMLESYSLGSVAQELGLRVDGQLHRALPDADLAARVMIALADRADAKTLDELLDLGRPPKLPQSRGDEQLTLEEGPLS